MPTQPEKMVCMEVWGGCDPINTAVAMSGLDAWVYSKPYCDHPAPARAHPSPAPKPTDSSVVAPPIENEEGGGDVYYVSACATGRINRLLVADVAGHGSAVRAVAVSLRDLMRRYVNYLDQTQFVTKMNAKFVRSSGAGVFATAVVTTFFAPTRTLSVCNAGHPAPLIFRRATGQWTLLTHGGDGRDAGNLPLGIVELDHADQFDATLDVGDLVLIYTDSLIEARDPTGELLGTAGLLRLANAAGLDPAAPATLVPALLAAIERESGQHLAADDVTCLLLRPTGHGTRASLGCQLAATFRLARGLVASLFRLKRPSLPDLHPANVPGTLFPRLQRLWRKK